MNRFGHLSMGLSEFHQSNDCAPPMIVALSWNRESEQVRFGLVVRFLWHDILDRYKERKFKRKKAFHVTSKKDQKKISCTRSRRICRATQPVLSCLYCCWGCLEDILAGSSLCLGTSVLYSFAEFLCSRAETAVISTAILGHSTSERFGVSASSLL